ncbi:MAG: hypothetical protein JRI23_29975 [Deltaproteobacteria bacterium]|jgi:hypothetical protein|nr:hypothetical protein [Deltaproteobacteria bacterium]MBW2536379.1 hypothetical protein [Deltaproteobacteria bacterium]
MWTRPALLAAGALALLVACSDSEQSPTPTTSVDGGAAGSGGVGGTGGSGGSGGTGGAGASEPTVPLAVHPDNPRYLVDTSGEPVRLAGHQIFVDLQDNGYNKEFTYGDERLLDWSWYLDFATERNLNFVRNWVIWSTGSGTAAPPNKIATPMMYLRTGPGTAADGQPKFDVTQFDQAFFDRMRTRIVQAGERGITVSIMLFEVYGFGPGEDEGGQTLWHGNVFHPDNNINGIDMNPNADEWGMEFFYTTDATVLALQKAYVDKVIDTVEDLDNVIFEVANELHATAWQLDMIDHIHTVEAQNEKQHLVYFSPGGRVEDGTLTRHDKSELTGSDAEVFGIAGHMGDYESDPPVDDSGKPVFWDNDHVWGTEWEHHRRAWMAFTRGYHFIFYDGPFEQPADETPAHERMRYNIGATVTYAERFADLARMDPHGELASTGFCLADPGGEYLIYQPTQGSFTVDLPAGDYDYEWFDPMTHAVDETGTVTATGGDHSFDPPAGFTADAVLYLVAAN